MKKQTLNIDWIEKSRPNYDDKLKKYESNTNCNVVVIIAQNKRKKMLLRKTWINYIKQVDQYFIDARSDHRVLVFLI